MRTLPTALFSRSPMLSFNHLSSIGLGVAAALLLAPAATAQSAFRTAAEELQDQPDPPPIAVTSSSSLPDAPSTVASLAAATSAAEAATGAEPMSKPSHADHKHPQIASPTDLTILPGQTAPHQTPRNKLVEAVRNSVSPFSIGGELVSAGYSHITNGSPNYGTNSTAFAQRFGASVARGTSQKLFSDGAMAAILHEDPRYYQMGNRQPFFKRITYAATRPLITRTDAGRRTPNLALLSGYLGAAALTKVYYPQPNQGFSQTLQTYGGSIGGAALGDVASEFLSDTLEFLRLKKVD